MSDDEKTFTVANFLMLIIVIIIALLVIGPTLLSMILAIAINPVVWVTAIAITSILYFMAWEK